MTAKELAIESNGRDTGEEMEWGEAQDAKAAGLVVVYGYSDDNVELCGAINDEVGAYNIKGLFRRMIKISGGPCWRNR